MSPFENTVSSVRDDPLYKSGMSHMQNGKWELAIKQLQDLLEKYPENKDAKKALDEAMFHANLDASGRKIRGKRWTLRLGPILLGIVLVGMVSYLIVLGIVAVTDFVEPIIVDAQENRRIAQLLLEADAYREAGDVDLAEERYQEVLRSQPDDEHAMQSLEEITNQREIEALYQKAVALDEAGDYNAALDAYHELSASAPRYRDVERRIKDIEDRFSIKELFLSAESEFVAGNTEQAIEKYESVQALNQAYEHDQVVRHLYELYLASGQEIINLKPANLELLPQALTYFTKALALQPRNAVAGREQQLAKLFLEGQSLFYQDEWDAAISALQIVYDTRPGYLDNTVVKLLYDAYVRSGDEHKGLGDAYLAYELYRKASELPLGDVAWAKGRMLYIEPFLTPTPTPTITPTPRPIVSGGGGGGGAVEPTPLVLSLYRGKILFFSDQRYRGELWVMNPDGSDRQALGREAILREQFEALEEQERFSPDGLRFTFNQIEGDDPNPQIYLTLPPSNRPGGQWYAKLTELPGMNYDPVWSPDGTRIAFVSQALGGDDIWVVNLDATYPHPLSPNTWEWDKHPSWSADSKHIVFWSNRSGLMQIYIMRSDQDNDKLEVTNISNTQWDEYDPIWVK